MTTPAELRAPARRETTNRRRSENLAAPANHQAEEAESEEEAGRATARPAATGDVGGAVVTGATGGRRCSALAQGHADLFRLDVDAVGDLDLERVLALGERAR